MGSSQGAEQLGLQAAGRRDVGSGLLEPDRGATNTQNREVADQAGDGSTPLTNCRIVRPREMRAMNIPTNGVQESHQAQ